MLDLKVRYSAALPLTQLLPELFFGLTPTLHAAKPDLNETLKEGGRSATEGRRGNRLRNALVVAEIALSVILLTGAGLMIRSVVRLLHMKLGFDPGNLLTMQLELPTSKYPENQQVTAFYRQLLERVKPVPGVQGAAVGNQPLL